MSRVILRIGAARARMFRRFLVEHGFVLFVLGPMVVGAVAWVAQRYLDLMREPLFGLLDAGTGFPDRSAAILGLGVAAVLWPSSLREVFGVRGGAQDLLDALPVTELERFFTAWTAAVARALGVCLIFVIGLWSLEQEANFFSSGEQILARVGILALAFAVIATLNLLLVVIWVPLGWASTERLLILVGAVVALAAGPWQGGVSLLMPWSLAGQPLRRGLLMVLGPGTAGVALEPRAASGLLVMLLLPAAAMAGAIYVRRRRRDLERAQALDLPKGRLRLPWIDLFSRLPRRLPPSTVAQLRRDLLMILRRFSPAVPAALALTLIADLGMVVLALDPEMPELWIRRSMVLAGFAGVLSVLSLVPFLLKAQLPVFWLEKSTGVALEHVWQTKWVLAGLIALPQVVIGGILIGSLSPGGWSATLVALAQLVITAGMAATLVGVAVFEIAEQPILGLLFSGFVASAASSLIIFYPQASWLWLIFFGYLVSLVAERASRRVRYTEVEL